MIKIYHILEDLCYLWIVVYALKNIQLCSESQFILDLRQQVKIGDFLLEFTSKYESKYY